MFSHTKTIDEKDELVALRLANRIANVAVVPVHSCKSAADQNIKIEKS